MKVEIRGEPIFYFEITREQLDLLMEMAALHYDGRCKATARQGGVLYGWLNLFRMHDDREPDPPTIEGRIEESDLQSLMKILEMRTIYHQSRQERDRDMSEDLNNRFWQAWKHANEKCKEWTTFITWEEPK